MAEAGSRKRGVVDYSRWDDIEVSDDEDATKRSIETNSLFRFRHQQRIERMVERKELQEDIDKLKREVSFDKESLEELLEKDSAEKAAILKTKIEGMEEEIVKLEGVLKKKEPLNIDNICHDGFSSTRISAKPTTTTGTQASKGPAKNGDAAQMMDEGDIAEFLMKNADLLKKLGQLSDWRKGREVFLGNRELCSEVGNHALSLHAINRSLALAETEAHNLSIFSLIASFLVEAGRDTKRDPREADLIRNLFDGLEKAEAERPGAMEREVAEFEKTFIAAAKERIMELRTAEEKGLSPDQVFPSLPIPMQRCFSNKDMDGLKKVSETMNPALFAYHMQRCSKAGLWVEPKEGTPE